jgi:hypothetical protein
VAEGNVTIVLNTHVEAHASNPKHKQAVRAQKYLENNNVQEKLKTLIHELAETCPEDPMEKCLQYFAEIYRNNSIPGCGKTAPVAKPRLDISGLNVHAAEEPSPGFVVPETSKQADQERHDMLVKMRESFKDDEVKLEKINKEIAEIDARFGGD